MQEKLSYLRAANPKPFQCCHCVPIRSFVDVTQAAITASPPSSPSTKLCLHPPRSGCWGQGQHQPGCKLSLMDELRWTQELDLPLWSLSEVPQISLSPEKPFQLSLTPRKPFQLSLVPGTLSSYPCPQQGFPVITGPRIPFQLSLVPGKPFQLSLAPGSLSSYPWPQESLSQPSLPFQHTQGALGTMLADGAGAWQKPTEKDPAGICWAGDVQREVEMDCGAHVSYVVWHKTEVY